MSSSCTICMGNNFLAQYLPIKVCTPILPEDYCLLHVVEPYYSLVLALRLAGRILLQLPHRIQLTRYKYKNLQHYTELLRSRISIMQRRHRTKYIHFLWFVPSWLYLLSTCKNISLIVSFQNTLLNILWSIRVQTMENSGRFVFYNNIYFFMKNQKQNNWHCVTCYVISMDYTLINRSSRPIRTRGLIRSCSYCKKYYLLKELSLNEGFPAVVEYVSLC